MNDPSAFPCDPMDPDGYLAHCEGPCPDDCIWCAANEAWNAHTEGRCEPDCIWCGLDFLPPPSDPVPLFHIGSLLPVGPFAPTVLSQIMRERHAAGTCGWGCPECQAESK